MVNDEIKKATGLNSMIEDFRIVTTPKLTVGAKLGKFAILTPENKEIAHRLGCGEPVEVRRRVAGIPVAAKMGRLQAVYEHEDYVRVFWRGRRGRHRQHSRQCDASSAHHTPRPFS